MNTTESKLAPVICIVGARPNYMKVAPIIRAFAAHNPPEFVAVSVCQNAAPRNLANAFETAIRAKLSESLTRKSAEAMAAKAGALEQAYPRQCRTYVLNIAKAEIGGLGEDKESLTAVLDAVLTAVQE